MTYFKGLLSVSVRANTALTNASSACLLTLSGPSGWSEGGQMRHAYIGEAWENARQIVSRRDFQPATGFDHRQDRRYFRTCFRTSNVNPVLPPQCDRAHRVLDQVITQL